MPEIVARGREKDGVRACALCHYHTGMGKMENAGVAGLPVNYFMQAMAAFASGARTSADLRKHNTHEMIAIAKALTPAETSAAACKCEARFRAKIRHWSSGPSEPPDSQRGPARAGSFDGAFVAHYDHGQAGDRPRLREESDDVEGDS